MSQYFILSENQYVLVKCHEVFAIMILDCLGTGG